MNWIRTSDLLREKNKLIWNIYETVNVSKVFLREILILAMVLPVIRIEVE